MSIDIFVWEKIAIFGTFNVGLEWQGIFFIIIFHEDLVIYLFTHRKIKQLFCTCDLNVLKLYFKLELEIFLY
jgi:hypothetical protein